MDKKIYSDWTVKVRSEETGKVFEACVPGCSRNDAIHAFFECYRHGIYTVLDATEGEPYTD